MRCLALAQEFKKRNIDVIFLTKSLFKHIEGKIKNEGFIIKRINSRNLSDDANRLIGFAKEYNFDWIILDGYKFTESYQRLVKESGLKLLCIDDIAKTKFVADLILNQNPSARKKNYTAGGSKLLLGDRFILLRDDFLSLKPKINRNRNFKILINFGVSIPSTKLLLKILKSLSGVIKNSEIVVITGVKELNLASFKHVFKENSNNIIKCISWRKFHPRLIKDMDFALSSAGSVLWELVYLGIPAICFILFENQISNAQIFGKKGYGINIGWLKNVNCAKISSAIRKLYLNNRLRRNISAKLMKVIDGKGRRRVVDEIINFDKKYYAGN
ncbi:MAG: UDP-2,4-diacetamido-2,4,6-trideoxy-beta-L-altropyranose hydrolase [Candidatus Omnitrophica bacterium]|nr:UDP-2,4-diacetamido-2,4,6-trideoxy-beta-L-altropyranose hydrolase [Candidatus Omnitrophota bacterium]